LFISLLITVDIHFYLEQTQGGMFAITNGKPRRSGVIQPSEFSELVEGIEEALVRFKSISNNAVLRLYQRSNMPSTPHATSSTTPDFQPRHNPEEDSLLNSADNEHVFPSTCKPTRETESTIAEVFLQLSFLPYKSLLRSSFNSWTPLRGFTATNDRYVLRDSWWIRFFTRISVAVSPCLTSGGTTRPWVSESAYVCSFLLIFLETMLIKRDSYIHDSTPIAVCIHSSKNSSTCPDTLQTHRIISSPGWEG